LFSKFCLLVLLVKLGILLLPSTHFSRVASKVERDDRDEDEDLGFVIRGTVGR
jgi:hypothetical protein